MLQQILVLPYLPFTIGHAILASTTTKVPHGDPEFLEYITDLFIHSQQTGVPRTDAQKADLVRQMVELNYDKEWLKDPMNRAKFERLLPTVVGRPAKVIGTSTPYIPCLPRIQHDLLSNPFSAASTSGKAFQT